LTTLTDAVAFAIAFAVQLFIVQHGFAACFGTFAALAFAINLLFIPMLILAAGLGNFRPNIFTSLLQKSTLVYSFLMHERYGSMVQGRLHGVYRLDMPIVVTGVEQGRLLASNNDSRQ
jgi:hypothetical protein